MTAPRPVSPETLLAQAGWVRALARGLLRDADAAEDVVQETWLAALRRGPREGRPLGAWLGKVASNFARRRMRADARRGEHERLAAAKLDSGAPTDLDERAALHRELVEVVMTLEEPYRSTILLRYFEELPPRAIARREGVPVQTVKTRLARALEKLREKLEARSRGDRTAWLSALAAFTRKPFSLTAAPTVATIMSTNLKLVAAGALLTALVATFLVVKKQDAEDPTTLAHATHASSDSAPEGLSSVPASIDATPVTTARSNEVQPRALPAAASALEPIDPDHDLHGIVTNSAGRPLPGARIDIHRSEARGFEIMRSKPELAADTVVATVASDDRGAFRVRLPRARPFDLVANLSGYAERKLPSRLAGEEVRVVLTAGCTIFGRVTRKPQGAPCAGAVVHVAPGIVRMNGQPEYSAETDDDGAYRLEGLPSEPLELDVEARDALGLWGMLVDGREGAEIERNVGLDPGVIVTGVVTEYATGLPVVGAEVDSSKIASLGIVHTDEAGAYTLRGIHSSPGIWISLRASAGGFATLQRMVKTATSDPIRVDFQLAPGRTARGRVLGPDDRPLAGAIVIACGRGSSDGAPFYDSRSTRSGADGTFEITHLAEAAHHMLFLRRENCGTKVYDFPQDEGPRAVIDFGDLHLPDPSTILGRVVDEHGLAVRDAYVAIEGANADAQRFSAPESGTLHTRDTRRTTRTDDQGRFGFCDLAPGGYAITASAMRGSATSTQGEVRLEEGETREDVALVLRTGLFLEGHVVGPDGSPVPGMSVRVIGEKSKDQATNFTGADGSFHLQGLEEGEYTVYVEAFYPPSANCSQDCASSYWRDVRAGSCDLTLVLPPVAWIEGTVLDAEGAPAADAVVQAYVDASLDETTIFLPGHAPTDATGHFRVPVAAGSRVVVQAFAPTTSPVYMARMPDVAAGTTDVKLQLAPWR